jgi:hypothetical protein
MQSAQQSAFNLRPAFLGGPNFPGLNVSNAVEPVLVAATAATGTINFDAGVQSIVYFTANASANWTLNIRGSETMRLDTLMKENQVLTVAHLVTQGGTAYYNNALTIDGVSVTPKYQGGSAWAAGNTSSIDVYTYNIVKTGPGTFTVFASQTQFK